MNRAAIAALWIGSLVVTWRLARSDEHVAREPAPAPETARSSPPSSPSIVHMRSGSLPALDDRVFRAAETQLEHDLADGRWSIADRDRLNAALPRVTGEQANQLIAMLFPKLNAGTVKSEIDGPPL